MNDLKITLTTMTLGEFKKYLSAYNAKKFILFYENQAWYSVDSNIRFDLSFSNAIVNTNPNRIAFSNNDGCSIIIDKIEYVIIDEESMLGAICTLVCKPTSKSHNKYTFIIQ